MANITMTLEDGIIKKVKKIAVEKNTTLTGIIRDYLTRLAKREEQRRQEVIEELSAMMNDGKVKIDKITWTRDELHER